MVQEHSFASHTCMKDAWVTDCETPLDPNMPTFHPDEPTIEIMNSAKLWEYYKDNFDQTSIATG